MDGFLMQSTGVVNPFQSHASKSLVNRRDGYLSFAKSFTIAPQSSIQIELRHISTPILEFAIGVELRSIGKALD